MSQYRLHYYNFSFSRIGESPLKAGASTMQTGASIIGLDYNRVTLADITKAKQALFNDPTDQQNATLIATTYLGHMTEAEFTGVPSKSSNDMPLKDAIELLRMEAHDMEPDPSEVQLSKAWSVLLSFAESI